MNKRCVAASIAVRRLDFANGNRARAVEISANTKIEAVVDALALGDYRALVVVIGGASGMSFDAAGLARPLLVDGLMTLALREGIAVVDGGTDAGVVRLVGEGAEKNGLSAPLLGICPRGAVRLPSEADSGRSVLEPHHTQFVLTPGVHFGTEAEIMYGLIAAMASKVPSAALLVNGGKLARREAELNAQQGRPVLACRGTGRAADEIARVRERAPADDRTSELAAATLTADAALGPEALSELLRAALWEGTR